MPSVSISSDATRPECAPALESLPDTRARMLPVRGLPAAFRFLLRRQHHTLKPSAPSLLKALAAGIVTCLLYAAAPLRAEHCAIPGEWLTAGQSPSRLTQRELLQEVAGKRVVLLGEEHDDAQHHNWQLHMLAALHAVQPDMVIGFEGFPRRVQPVLAQWVDGQLTEAQFLRAVNWDEIWGLDAKLYMPLFQFARMHRIPLLALNVDRALVRAAGNSGWAAIPATQREGVGDPEPATPAYLEKLYPAFRSHGHDEAAPNNLEDPEFRNFVDGMLVWDRAMAEALASSLAGAAPGGRAARLAVGIVGRGHAEYFHGIPRQLAALGIGDVAVLLPWDIQEGCTPPPAGIADAVFGLRAKFMQSTGMRLGVELASVESGNGVRIQRVSKGSVAAASGLLDGDVIEKVAGLEVTGAETVVAAIRRQAPGTWLPLNVRREGKLVEVVAKFPPHLP